MRVIIADADPATRAGWIAELGEIGVAAGDVVETPDVKGLLQTITDGGDVSLVIASWVLSGMNGFTLLGEVRQRRRGAPTPILAVGEPGDRVAMEACTKVGLTAFVVKPADSAEFRRKATRALFGEAAAERRESESRKVLRSIVSTAEAEMELPFFIQLPSNLMTEFLRLAVNRKFPKGSTLIQAGKPVEALMVLTLGQAEMRDGSTSPRLLDMGECFGEMAFLTEQPNTCTVVAAGPVEIHSLDRAGLAELVKRQPMMTQYLSALVSRRSKVQAGRLPGAPSSGMGGSLASMPFPDLIQMLHSTHKSGVLTLEDGTRKSGIVFDDGNVTHAWTDDLSGVPAFNRIAGWKKGLFYFRAGSRATHPNTIRGGTLPLLMEAMRLIDESTRGGGGMPSVSA